MNCSPLRCALALFTVAVISQATAAEAQLPPTFAKSFAPSAIAVGGTSTLTFTIDNSAEPMSVTGLDFTDNLPAGLVVATPSNATSTCLGTLTATNGAGTVTLTGGALGAGATCTVSVDVTTSGPGMFVNVTGDLTSSAGNSGTASDTLTVDPPPAFSAAFAPQNATVGGTSTLTFTIDNTASTTAATALDFTNVLPAGLTVASSPSANTTCTGGTLTAVDGSGVISYTGGTVAAGASCTVSASVTQNMAGDYVNTSGDLTSSLGNSGTASDTLRANPAPGFTAAFAPDTLAPGGTATLTFTIDNTGSTVDATGMGFTNDLPTDVTVATTPNASTTCTGGTLTAVGGAGTLSYMGGTVATGATCTVSVDVTVATAGVFVNTSGLLGSSLGVSGTASATLSTVDAPGFSVAFTPAVVALDVDAESTITFTIDNSAGAATVTDLAFTHQLPAGVEIVIPLNSDNDCGGSFNVALMGGTISLMAGSVAAGATCTVSVDVAATSAGEVSNTTGELTSSAGSSGTASATLTANPAPTATASLTSIDLEPDDQTTFAVTLDNGASTEAATDVAFTLDLPGGVTAGMPAMASTTCTAGAAAVSAGSGGEQLSFSGGEIAAGSSCVVTLTLFGAIPGEYTLTPSTVSSNLGDASLGAVMLTVESAIALTKSFDPGTIALGEFAVATYTVDNSGGYRAASGITFTESLPSSFDVTEGSTPSTDCPGATLDISGGLLTLSGGTLDPGASCTVTVRFTPVFATTFTTHTSQLTSSLGTAPAAQAALVVGPRPSEGSSCAAGAPRGASPWALLLLAAVALWRRRR